MESSQLNLVKEWRCGDNLSWSQIIGLSASPLKKVNVTEILPFTAMHTYKNVEKTTLIISFEKVKKNVNPKLCQHSFFKLFWPI